MITTSLKLKKKIAEYIYHRLKNNNIDCKKIYYGRLDDHSGYFVDISLDDYFDENKRKVLTDIEKNIGISLRKLFNKIDKQVIFDSKKYEEYKIYKDTHGYINYIEPTEELKLSLQSWKNMPKLFDKITCCID